MYILPPLYLDLIVCRVNIAAHSARLIAQNPNRLVHLSLGHAKGEGILQLLSFIQVLLLDGLCIFGVEQTS